MSILKSWQRLSSTSKVEKSLLISAISSIGVIACDNTWCFKTQSKVVAQESHIFKTVSQELCSSDGRSRHIAADGHRPCEGARY